jgi:hypothetical protein
MNPVYEAFTEVMQPGSNLSIGEWFSKYVKVVDSPHGANYDINQTPWFKEIAEAVADNYNDEIVIVAPVGSGKTAFYEALIQWITSEEPGFTMVAMQTDQDAKDLWETRLSKAMKLCSPINNLWPKDRNAIRKGAVIFPHMSLLMGGANLSNLQSKSCRWVIGDEVWLWKPGMLDEARGRTHDRWNARLLFVSQGGEEGTDWHNTFKETNQCHFNWFCEECEKPNKWSHSNIKYEKVRDTDDQYDLEAIKKSVYMECPHCKAKYKDDATTRRRLSFNSKYIPENERALSVKKGYTYTDYAVWWKPWSKLVLRWIKASDEMKRGYIDPMKKLKQKRLADFWKDDFGDVKIKLLAADYKKADFLAGELWEGELYRVMTVDVQRDHYWLVMRTWKADGTSRLLYEGKIATDEVIRDIQIKYKVQDKLVFLDAQFDTGRVYDYCVKYGWTALHGHGNDGFTHTKKRGKRNIRVRKFYSKYELAQAPSGGQAPYIFWSNEKIKDTLMILRAGQGMAWEVPEDVSEDYKHQIDSEVKREVINKATGQVSKRYVKIKKDNHLLDCEAMQVAAAMMLNVLKSPEIEVSS